MLHLLPQPIQDKLKQLLEDYMKSKGTLYTKKNIFILLIFIYGLYNFFKHHGWLPKKSLRGEHVFLTGAGSGLGRYMALQFAKLGCKQTLTDINVEGLEETKRMIFEAVGTDKNVVIFKCDVSDKESVTNAGKVARQNFGEVTILINNAGIVSGKKILENSDFMIKKTIEVNTIALLYTIREFLPDMIRLNKGHVVTVSSLAGTTAVPGQADYSASKFGAFAIDECLRTEMLKQGYNIRTTCICPNYINTGMFEGAKLNWPFTVLDQHWVVWRIITAIRQNEAVVLMPWMANLTFIMRGIAPVPLFDFINKFLGGHDSMDKFKGRVLAQPNRSQ